MLAAAQGPRPNPVVPCISSGLMYAKKGLGIDQHDDILLIIDY